MEHTAIFLVITERVNDVVTNVYQPGSPNLTAGKTAKEGF
jgi:hypothetical protein